MQCQRLAFTEKQAVCCFQQRPWLSGCLTLSLSMLLQHSTMLFLITINYGRSQDNVLERAQSVSAKLPISLTFPVSTADTQLTYRFPCSLITPIDTIAIDHISRTSPTAPSTLLSASYPVSLARTLSPYIDRQLEVDLTADLEDFASGAVNPPNIITIESRFPTVYTCLVLQWMRRFAESGGEDKSAQRPEPPKAKGAFADR